MSAPISNVRPQPDQVLADIADYVIGYEVQSAEAYRTAHYCLLDTLGCGFEALEYPACTKLLGPIAPGTVVKTRTVPYHILGLATPLKATQLLYRATNARGEATVNATSVVQPSCLLCLNREKVLSYQSFYDSLNPDDQPSV